MSALQWQSARRASYVKDLLLTGVRRLSRPKTDQAFLVADLWCVVFQFRNDQVWKTLSEYLVENLRTKNRLEMQIRVLPVELLRLMNGASWPYTYVWQVVQSLLLRQHHEGTLSLTPTRTVAISPRARRWRRHCSCLFPPPEVSDVWAPYTSSCTFSSLSIQCLLTKSRFFAAFLNWYYWSENLSEVDITSFSAVVNPEKNVKLGTSDRYLRFLFDP